MGKLKRRTYKQQLNYYQIQTNIFFMLQVTYNVPMILFWSLSFYCFLQLLITQKTRYYYLGGLAVGCLLLAKYTGILLIISLFLGCLYYKDYRFILKSMHLYVGLGLALLLFSPVLIWNFQHDWMSFKFQLNHGFHSDANHPLVQVTSYLLHNFIEYNISLVALIVLIWQQRKTVFQPQQGMLFFPTFFVLFFFLATSFFAPTDINWSAPAFFTGLILLAHYLSALQRKIIPYILFGMLSGLSFTLVVGDSQPKFTINKLGGWGMSYALQKILPMIPEENYQNKMIVTETYQLSGLVAYFLKLQPDSVINMGLKRPRNCA